MSDSSRADSFMHQLFLAEKKLAEFDVKWDGEKYVFNPPYKPRNECECSSCMEPGLR